MDFYWIIHHTMNKIKCLTANTQETEKVSNIQLELKNSCYSEGRHLMTIIHYSHVVDGLLLPPSVPQ